MWSYMNVNYIKVIDCVVYLLYSLNASEVYLWVDIKCLIKILNISFKKVLLGKTNIHLIGVCP